MTSKEKRVVAKAIKMVKAIKSVIDAALLLDAKFCNPQVRNITKWLVLNHNACARLKRLRETK